MHVMCDLRDVDDLDNVMASQRPDIVVNMAALLFGTAEENLKLAMEVNCVAADDIARLSVRNGVELLVHFSTKAVYAPTASAATEQSRLGPSTNYGISKLASEYAVRRTLNGSSTTGAILRMGSTYGPGKGPEHGAVAWMSTLVSRVVAGETVRVYVEPESGSDYIYNVDVASAVEAICRRFGAWRLTTETMNVTSGERTSARDVCDHINELSGRHSVMTVHRPDEADIVVPSGGTVLDGAKAEDLVGFIPAYDTRSGLAHYWEHHAGGA